jgi:hypothetical protein
VLAALPAKLQADTVERLSAIGETDPESVRVVAQELAAWVASQATGRRGKRTTSAASAVLAAAESATREAILSNVKQHKQSLAEVLDRNAKPIVIRETKPAPPRQVAATERDSRQSSSARVGTQVDFYRLSRAALGESNDRQLSPPRIAKQPPSQPRSEQSVPTPRFEDLVLIDRASFTRVMNEVDPKVLVLALAGASHEILDRILRVLPRRAARLLRKQLYQLGPTRLADVESAQQLIARAAARQSPHFGGTAN